MIGNAIYQRLSGYAGLTALVPAARMYPLQLDQNTVFPAVSWQQISGRRESAMGTDPGIVEGRWQVDSWSSRTALEARTVAAQVRAALKRFRGTLDGTAILDVYLENELEDYEADTRRYRVFQDYRIWWRE